MEMKCAATHINIKDPDEWNGNAVAMKWWLFCSFSFLVQYTKIGNISSNFCSIELVYTCSAICFKTVQAVSFLETLCKWHQSQFHRCLFCYILLIFIHIHFRKVCSYNVPQWENSNERERDDERDMMKEKKKKGKNQFC